ncbi:hypothetical protein [Clostridium perfringens]|uniref:hypothetical protein n=1 Tax=Clostridium perfringens TaxID=1502 RepID=UPI0024BCD2E3|nr:hypothetical protein [Clostridium perfringens]
MISKIRSFIEEQSFLRDIVGIKNGKIDMITGISILILGSLGILLIIFNCLKKN